MDKGRVIPFHCAKLITLCPNASIPSVSAILGYTAASIIDREQPIFLRCTKGGGAGTGNDVTNCGRGVRQGEAVSGCMLWVDVCILSACAQSSLSS